MCVSCRMGLFRDGNFSFRRGYDNCSQSYFVELILWKFGISLDSSKVRPWLKPEFHYKDGSWVRLTKDQPAENIAGPAVYGLMWGNFHVVFEGF